jgi:CRP/FNR family transcriptional regulator
MLTDQGYFLDPCQSDRKGGPIGALNPREDEMDQRIAPNRIKPDLGCATCPIRYRAVCARCEQDELSQLESIKAYRRFDAGQTILMAGDDLEHLSSVVEGTAVLTRSLEDGRRQMVGMLLPSDFIGRPGRSTSAYDVTAATDVLLCSFRRQPFERVMEHTPHIGQRMLEMTLDELEAARDWMLLLGRKTARERVASFLVFLMRRSPDGMPRAVIPISREAMAEYLGLTIETVSRQMSALRKAGVITLQGTRSVAASDWEALLEAAGDDGDGGVIS